ncbi:uncharacterized protein BDR25DRAFT_362904 [Lindgomyces ingoldianus]|uniref:Uncharacterized protein n=1 Tax=Lindgomyces ingoldianus TaxID=673940 RepID=A0ACB6QAF6_9PLEO|nr:uncharacterized protein BDR25DRAFT_362904 [Lindgomyces ingoldianus]KAF2463362.1 hypothetical protein BDR25DRAFT_362904 [Lindgomyces ingoldianus]
MFGATSRVPAFASCNMGEFPEGERSFAWVSEWNRFCSIEICTYRTSSSFLSGGATILTLCCKFQQPRSTIATGSALKHFLGCMCLFSNRPEMALIPEQKGQIEENLRGILEIQELTPGVSRFWKGKLKLNTHVLKRTKTKAANIDEKHLPCIARSKSRRDSVPQVLDNMQAGGFEEYKLLERVWCSNEGQLSSDNELT